MKQKSDALFRIWSLVMILSGIILLALDGYLMVLRFKTPELSRFLTLIATLLLLACAVLEIVCGIKSIAFISTASRGRRFRAVQSKIRTFKRLSLAAIILALLQIILSCVFGIIIWQLALIVLFGIITPLIELLSTRALHS